MPSKNPSSSNATAARLIPQGSHAGAHPIDINRPAFVIGSRKEAVRFHLESSTVSKCHCVIIAHEWGCSIHDLGSRTHTVVNGMAVEDVELEDGDIINIGRFEFKYTAPSYAYGKPRSAPQGELDVSTLTDPLPITKRVLQIGRRRGGDLQFEDKAVSNIHAIIYERNARRYVRDLTSRTGTWLNGKLVHQEEILPGSIIKIGPVEIGYREMLPEAESISGFAAIPVDEDPIQIVSDEIPPSIDADNDKSVEAELDLGLIPVADTTGPADTMIPLEDSISESAVIPVKSDEIPRDVSDTKLDQDEEDALTALRKGWKGASQISDEAVIPLDEPAVAETPAISIEPVAEIAPDAPAEEELIALDPPVLDLAEIEEIATPVADEPLPITEDEIAAIVDELPLETDAPKAEVEAIAPVEEPILESSVAEEPIAELDLASVEVPEEAPVDVVEPELVVEEIAQTVESADQPIDLDSLEDLLPEPVAEETVEPVAEIAPEPAIEIPVVDDVSDDDGAIDLTELPPAPVADSMAEPDLLLETEDAGTHETAPVAEAAIIEEPVIESPVTSVPEVAEIDDLIEEDDLFEEIAQHPGSPFQIADEHEDITEITPPTMERIEIVDDSGLPAIESKSQVGELPTESAFFDDTETHAPAPAEPVLDLSMPLAPLEEDTKAEETSSTFQPADESINIEELLVEPDVTESPETASVIEEAAKPESGPEDLVLLDDTAEASESDDTAFAVGLENLDQFDLDDEDPFDDPPEPFTSRSEKVEVIEPTIASPESAMPAELDDTAADADLDDLLKDLGIEEDQLDLDGLPEGEGGDPVEEHTDKLTAEAKKTENEIDELLKPDKTQNQTTSLSDLIPKDPPLVGGLFGGMSGMSVGGSPMVDLSKPMLPRAESPRPKPPTIQPPSADADKPHRVGFGGLTAQSPQSHTGSPFSDSPKPIADVLIGRRAQQSVDVFANPSPTQEDLQQEGQIADELETDTVITPGSDTDSTTSSKASTPEELEILRTADRYRPRGVIRAMSDVPITPPPTPVLEPEAIAADRKKRLRRVFLCTILMLPLAGLAAGLAWKLLPASSRIDATITFKRLNQLSEKDASIFRNIQDDLLISDSTLQTAIQTMEQSVKGWGFLKDTNTLQKAIEREPKIRWPEKPGDTMHISVHSQDKADDVARVRALATALVKANTDRILAYRDLTRKIADQEAEVQLLQTKVKSINEDLQKFQALGEARADNSTIDEAEGKARKLENELKESRTRRMEVESRQELLKKTPFVELAPLQDEQFYQNDDELKKLNAGLNELQNKYTADTAEGEKQIRAARETLDELIKKFQSSLEAAPKAANVPANLAKYVEGAKRVFKQTHDLTDELLHRQEQQRSRLSELKTRLSSKIEKQTRDVLDNDEELKKNRDALEMYKRQQNAAVAEGMNEEAKKLSLQMQLMQSLLDARIDKLKHDPVYEETISSLQSIIDQTEKSIQEDRKHVDQTLTLAQEEFSKTAPEVATLPDDQKEVAASIDSQLKSISDARKAYTKAADEAETATSVRESQFKEANNSIFDKIRDRKSDLMKLARDDQADRAEKIRKSKLDDLGKELALLVRQEEAINKNLEIVTASLQKMRQTRVELTKNDQLRDEMQGERGRLEAEIRSRNADLNNKRNQIASRIYPEEQFELQSYDDSETRPLLRPAVIGGSAGAVFLLMLIPIVWNLMLASRDSHQLAKVQGTHTAGPESPHPQATNGQAKEEDSAILNP